KLRAAGDAIITTRTTAPASRGSKISFMVRPEAIRVLGDSESEQNVLNVKLKDAIVAGAVTKLFGVLDDGHTISVTQLTKGGASYQPGSSLRLGWSADHTVVLN